MINEVLNRMMVMAGLESEVQIEESRGISDSTWDSFKMIEKRKYVKEHPTSRFAKDPKYGMVKRKSVKLAIKNSDKKIAFDENDPSTWKGNYEKVKKYAKKVGINRKYFTDDEEDDIKFMKRAIKEINNFKQSLSKKSLSNLIKRLDKEDLNVRGRTDDMKKQHAIEDLVAAYIYRYFS